eukprot:5960654-Alexandrium_andersonii.AAC.1
MPVAATAHRPMAATASATACRRSPLGSSSQGRERRGRSGSMQACTCLSTAWLSMARCMGPPPESAARTA